MGRTQSIGGCQVHAWPPGLVPDCGNQGIKKNTNRWTDRKLGLGRNKPQGLRSSVYFPELTGEAGLLWTYEQEDRVYGVQLDRKDRLTQC